jgi:hypothetical protein
MDIHFLPKSKFFIGILYRRRILSSFHNQYKVRRYPLPSSSAAALMIRSVEIESLVVVLFMVPCAGASIMKINGKSRSEGNYRRVHTLTSTVPFHIGGTQ